MANKYENILSGYLNKSPKNNREYIVITNVSGEQIVLDPGEKLYLNRTPAEIKKKYPKIPDFQKSIRVDEKTPSEQNPSKTVNVSASVKAEDLPF